MQPTASILILAAALTACHRGAESSPPVGGRAATADSVVLERTRCFGTCPAYRVSVARSGRVVFLSREPGDARVGTDSIPPAAAARLLADAEKAGVYSLPDSIYNDDNVCPTRATDFPQIIVTLFDPQGPKAVVDYGGCFESMGSMPSDWSIAPKLEPLRAYEAAIDSAAGSSRWIRSAVPTRGGPNER